MGTETECSITINQTPGRARYCSQLHHISLDNLGPQRFKSPGAFSSAKWEIRLMVSRVQLSSIKILWFNEMSGWRQPCWHWQSHAHPYYDGESLLPAACHPEKSRVGEAKNWPTSLAREPTASFWKLFLYAHQQNDSFKQGCSATRMLRHQALHTSLFVPCCTWEANFPLQRRCEQGTPGLS